MIRLEHASKIYRSAHGEVRALDDVSLEIAAGEFVAVRGPSGCGKSTMLALIGGLSTPSTGRVFVAGTDLAALSPRERNAFRAANVGFVFQLFHLLPYLTVWENALVGVGPGNAPAAQRARELLEKFQLVERRDHRPSQLSIGERQRAALVRALINAPRLVLADEPTGNLDPANARAVLDALAEYQRAGGTVLLVTHDDAAAVFASRTIAMAHGRVVAPAETAPV